MRRLVAWVLDGLPFDPRSRRALDETLLDWATETGRETSSVQRAFAHALGLAGVLRAMIGCSFGEIGRVPFGWLVPRFLLFGVPMALLMASASLVNFAKAAGYVSAAEGVVWLLPANLIGAAAPALLLAVSWRSGERRIPAIGSAITASLAMFILISCVLPWSNQMFNERAASRIASNQGTPRAAQVPNEPTVVDFIRQLDGAPAARNAAINELGWIAGFSVIAGATVLLGVGLSRRLKMRGLHLTLAIPAAYLFVGLASFLMVAPMIPTGFRDAAVVWMFVVLTLGLFALVHRKADDAPAIEPLS